MRILVTGGTGKVGIVAVRVLAGAGHDVTVIGRSVGHSIEGAQYQQCDVNDYDTLLSTMEGHNAVVHLAAIPHPLGTPGREIFRVNNLGTFNVFEAAAQCGITRVVAASSINAFGYFFGDRGFPIRYLPIDEEHEGIATDAYSFSKQIMESTGRYFWDRDRISSVLLRLPAVLPHDRTARHEKHRGEQPAPIALRLLGMSDEERLAEARRLSEAYDTHRATHRLEHAPKDWMRATALADESVITIEELRFMSHKANLFTYVDELDSAQAILKGVEADYQGSHPLYINSTRNSSKLSVEDAARLFWPPVQEIRRQPEGETALVSIARARELIGFEPEHVGDR
jgi:nucleoside-diphosphate-sugar epimerase